MRGSAGPDGPGTGKGRAWVAGLLAALVLTGCETVELNPPPADQIRADAGMVVDDREIVALVASEAAADRLGAGAAAEGFTPREVTRLGGGKPPPLGPLETLWGGGALRTPHWLCRWLCWLCWP